MKNLLPPLVIASLVLGLASGCSRQSQADRLLARGDRAFAAHRYGEAEIDYLNALRLVRLNAHAIGQLGLIYFDEGRVGRSLPCLTQARRLDPDNLAVRLKLGLYQLSLGQFAEAGEQAKFVLGKMPSNPDAPLLLAEAAVHSDTIAQARQILGHLPAPAAGSAPVLVALATLDFRERNFPSAQALLAQAQKADPKSSDARTAQAALAWARNDLAGADRAFAQAADLAPDKPTKRLQQAEFKIQTGDRGQARKILEQITRQAPDFLPAALLLAELDESERKFAESSTLTAQVLERDPTSPEALLLAGRLQLDQNRPADAIAALERARRIYPHFPKAEFELAAAYLATGATEPARECLNRAVVWDPNFTEAVLLLAQLNLQNGDPGSAAAALRPLIQRRPDLATARGLLAEADLAQNNLDEALALDRALAAAAPRDPRPILAAGLVLFRQGKWDDARQSADRALALAAGDSAAQSAAWLLRARVSLARQDLPQAEAALHRAIELHPDSPIAYFLLAGLDSDAHADAKALADLQAVVAGNPRDIRALMLIGLIRERQKDYPRAREAYEKILALAPNFSAALNNLAYLDSEYLPDPARALALAERARRALPAEPHVADTLGWILYKAHQYERAAALLQESAVTLPEEAEIAFHLGQTRYRLGQESAARTELERALRLNPRLPGAAAARNSLAILAVDPATAGPAERSRLEEAAASDPSDPIAAARLAAVYRRDGATDRARALLEKAEKSGPARTAILIQLAELDLATGQIDPAFALAKSAHALAPDNAEVDHILGVLADRKGDPAWAASLLQSAVSQQPDNPEMLFDLAQADYGLGRLDEASAAAQGALAATRPFRRRALAREFLAWSDLAAHPQEAAAPGLEAALRADPDNLPALMALGAVEEQRRDEPAARRLYQTALQRHPGFAPAQRRLVLLDAKNPADDRQARELFIQAREAYPSDRELARAGGIIAYRLGDYSRAAELLDEGSSQGGGDAEAMFYLGMAQTRLKAGSGRDALQRAVSLNLRPDLAAQARKVLAE